MSSASAVSATSPCSTPRSSAARRRGRRRRRQARDGPELGATTVNAGKTPSPRSRRSVAATSRSSRCPRRPRAARTPRCGAGPAGLVGLPPETGPAADLPDRAQGHLGDRLDRRHPPGPRRVSSSTPAAGPGSWPRAAARRRQRRFDDVLAGRRPLAWCSRCSRNCVAREPGPPDDDVPVDDEEYARELFEILTRPDDPARLPGHLERRLDRPRGRFRHRPPSAVRSRRRARPVRLPRSRSLFRARPARRRRWPRRGFFAPPAGCGVARGERAG